MIGHRVVLRPRSLLETGDLTLALVRAHRRQFVWLLPWVVVPAVASWGLHRFLGWDQSVALGLEWVLTALMSGVYTVLCGDLMLQPTTSLRSVQRRFLAHSPVYVVSRLAGWLLMSIFWWALVTYSYVIFTPEASLLERGSLGTTFARSSVLARSAPGRAVAYAVSCAALLWLGALGGELCHAAIRELFGLQVQSLANWLDNASWAAYLGVVVIQPYLAAFRFLLYIDCRTRREGWDLQVQFGALVASAASPLRHKQPVEEAA